MESRSAATSLRFAVGCTCSVTIKPGKPAKVDRSHCPIHHHLAGKA